MEQFLSPKALYQLQKAGIIARVATDKFTCNDGSLNKEFTYGSILIPVNGQKIAAEELFNLMESVAKNCNITIYGTKTGLTPKGIDLGSNGFSVLQKPSVMFAGDGSNSGDAGEISGICLIPNSIFLLQWLHHHDSEVLIWMGLMSFCHRFT